jgi:acyl carrier protein
VLQECIGLVIVPAPDRPRIGLQQLLELLNGHLHQSKWPFALVYMQDLPKNSAGKPLRINLGRRLNFGVATDSFSVAQRHLTADTPHPMSSLTEPITCAPVSLDLEHISSTLADMVGTDDVVVRLRHDGTVEAFMYAEQHIDMPDIKRLLMERLPGYCIPEPLHVIPHSLPKTDDGSIDLIALEKAVADLNAAVMSSDELLVRDVVASLLDHDASLISRESDIFLLGANSLLLGKLAYHLRKKTGCSIPVSSIFTNSTISGIASFIQDCKPSSPMGSDKSSAASTIHLTNSPMISRSSSYTVFDTITTKTRNQNHPLCLLVQAIPFVLFYPLTVALTCMFKFVSCLL